MLTYIIRLYFYSLLLSQWSSTASLPKTGESTWMGEFGYLCLGFAVAVAAETTLLIFMINLSVAPPSFLIAAANYGSWRWWSEREERRRQNAREMEREMVAYSFRARNPLRYPNNNNNNNNNRGVQYPYAEYPTRYPYEIPPQIGYEYPSRYPYEYPSQYPNEEQTYGLVTGQQTGGAYKYESQPESNSSKPTWENVVILIDNIARVLLPLLFIILISKEFASVLT